ncbi:MAG: TIGR01459 family HAD-type hydrolase [Pseudomonadota bacterium]
MSADPSSPPPLLAGLGAIAERYDGYLVDLWGVMHNGVAPYPAAVDCLARLKRQGKHVLLLSNAPRRAEDAKRRSAGIGIDPALYDDLICSGEETWRDLKAFDDPFYAGLGRRCLPIMARKDASLLDGLDLAIAADPEAADFLLAVGVEGPQDRVGHFRPLLEAARARDLPMVCANPDLEVVRGGVREICAGAIAEAYEAMGGRVRYHGKPHAGIYRRCFDRLAPIRHTRVLAVGDSLRTDIAGSGAAGIDSILVLGGLHEEELGGEAAMREAAADPQRMAALFEPWPHRPTYLMTRFGW